MLDRVLNKYLNAVLALWAQSQQGKDQINMWNEYKRMASLMSFGVFFINFEQISHVIVLFSLLTLNK